MRILTWCCSLGDPHTAQHHWLVSGMTSLGHQVIAVNSPDRTPVFGIRKMQRRRLD